MLRNPQISRLSAYSSIRETLAIVSGDLTPRLSASAPRPSSHHLAAGLSLRFAFAEIPAAAVLPVMLSNILGTKWPDLQTSPEV